MPQTPKLAWPFNVSSTGAVDQVEQDTDEEIAACCYAILATEVGTRTELIEFGIEDPTLLVGGVDPDVLLITLERWEPRAVTLATEDLVDLVQSVEVRI